MRDERIKGRREKETDVRGGGQERWMEEEKEAEKEEDVQMDEGDKKGDRGEAEAGETDGGMEYGPKDEREE